MEFTDWPARKTRSELGVEIKEREAEDESGGFKAVKGPLDEENKTPGGLVAQGAALMLSKATGKEEAYRRSLGYRQCYCHFYQYINRQIIR